MKSYINKITGLAAALGLIVGTGCADVYVEEYVAEAPQIESFSPATALSGEDTPVVVTGRNLQAVTSAYIGGREVKILERVSNTRMTIIATKAARTGKVELVNAVGRTESSTPFTMSYPVPVINTAQLEAQVEMFGELTLKGVCMGVVNKVIVTSDGSQEGREAQIKSQSPTELIVVMPYTEQEKAKITLRYMEADEEVETPFETAPEIGIVRLTPQVDAPAFDRMTVGRVMTVTGTNLDQISAVKVGGVAASIVSCKSGVLRFTVPIVQGFVEGDNNQTDLKIDYFANFESATILETVPVTMLRYKVWEGVTTFCQEFTCLRLESFFSPETGIVYHNNRWRGELDKLSFDKQGKVCSATNTPSVTEAEYNSVHPYFFFSGVKGSGASACTIQIMGPAASNSQFKNFYYEPNKKDEFRLLPMGGYGTPVLSFRLLDDKSTIEKALADKVRNLDFTTIDEQTFPIDPANKTVAGVLISSPSGSSKSTEWAPGIFTPDVESLDTDVDAVLLVLYYDYRGFTGDTPLANVKRVGFIHLRKVNFRPVAGAPSASDITYNVYWQKSDYQH